VVAVLLFRGIGFAPLPVGASILALILFPGSFIWELVEPLEKSRSRTHRFAFTVAVSIGANTLMMFFLGFINEINFVAVLLTYSVLNVTLFLLAFTRNRADVKDPRSARKSAWLDALLIVISAVIVAFYFFHAFAVPFTSWDAIASYNSWAVKITRGRTLEDVGTSGFSLYPLGVPLSYTWVYLVSGEIIARAAHGVSPIFGVVALAYCFLFARELRSSGALAVFLALLSPLFATHLIAGYADLPSAAFTIASAFYLIRGLRSEGNSSDLVLAGVMAALALWMKPTGFYVLVAAPIAYLAARGRHASIRGISAVLLGETVSVPWLLYALVTRGPAAYVQDAQALSSAGELWGQQNPDLVVRLERAVNSLAVAGNSLSVAPGLLLLLAGLVYTASRERSVRCVAIFYVALFLPIWLLLFSYDARYLVSFLPLMAALASAAVTRSLNILGARDELADHGSVLGLRRLRLQALAVVLLTLVLTIPTLSALEDAAQGPGPTVCWSFTHAFSTDDEKLLVILGPFYNVVLFFKSNSQIYGAPVVSMDARYAGVFPNATYAWPGNLDDLRAFSFMIVPSWAFKVTWWNTTPLANLIRNGSNRIRLIYEVNWEEAFKGYGDGYRVFEVLPRVLFTVGNGPWITPEHGSHHFADHLRYREGGSAILGDPPARQDCLYLNVGDLRLCSCDIDEESGRELVPISA